MWKWADVQQKPLQAQETSNGNTEIAGGQMAIFGWPDDESPISMMKPKAVAVGGLPER